MVFRELTKLLGIVCWKVESSSLNLKWSIDSYELWSNFVLFKQKQMFARIEKKNTQFMLELLGVFEKKV